MGSLLGFWGLRVPPGKKVTVEVDEDRVELVHVTKVALGPKPGTADHCVMISNAEHNDIAVCTLDPDERQSSVEFVLSSSTTIHHTGNSDVYLSGFKSNDGDMSDEEDDQLPAANGANGVANGRVTVPAASGQAPGGKVGQFFVPEHLTDDEANASDELREVELDSDDMIGTFSDGDEDEGDEDEDEDDDSYADEDEDMSDGGSDLEGLETEGGQGDEDKGEEGEGSEDEDEEGSEGEGESEGEEEEEEPTPAGKSAKKRPADLPATTPATKKQATAATPATKKQATAALTPAPAKKHGVQVKEAPGTTPAKVAVKAEAKPPKSGQQTPKQGAKTPKSDQKTPKTPSTPATPGTVAEFITAVKEALKGGPLGLSELGARVKKPKEVQKLKGFFLQHLDTFAVNDDKVSLK